MNISLVDRNATKHIAVVSDVKTGKILKPGRKAEHIHKKYVNMRTDIKIKSKYRKVKSTKNREKRIENTLNHKVSKKFLQEAK